MKFVNLYKKKNKERKSVGNILSRWPVVIKEKKNEKGRKKRINNKTNKLIH